MDERRSCPLIHSGAHRRPPTQPRIEWAAVPSPERGSRRDVDSIVTLSGPCHLAKQCLWH